MNGIEIPVANRPPAIIDAEDYDSNTALPVKEHRLHGAALGIYKPSMLAGEKPKTEWVRLKS